MATVYVHAERAREFRDLFFKWKRERDPLSRSPQRDHQSEREKQFVMVDDDFLPYMRAKGFPFRPDSRPV